MFRFIVHIIMCRDSEFVICDVHKFSSVYIQRRLQKTCIERCPYK